MGFPSEGAESMYRNKLSSVVSFLESKHRYHYKLYNLYVVNLIHAQWRWCFARCSERVYAACKFKNRVAYYPFDDHSAPPLMLIEAFCIDIVSIFHLYGSFSEWYIELFFACSNFLIRKYTVCQEANMYNWAVYCIHRLHG